MTRALGALSETAVKPRKSDDQIAAEIASPLPDERHLGLRDTAAFIAVAHEVREALGRQKSPVVLVTNEVGFGIVPDNALARAFRDAAGLLNQMIARVADEVEFVVAGLPMRLK